MRTTTKQTIREMRKESKKRPTQVAYELGVSERSLYNWEQGHSIPNIVIIDRILIYYNKSYEQLNISQWQKTSDGRERLNAHKA